MAAPCDLAITCSHEKSNFLSFTAKETRQKLISEAAEYRYKYIGIEYIGEIIETTSKKNKQIKQLVIPEPNPKDNSTSYNLDSKSLTIYNRITVPLPESKFIPTLNNASAQKFEIVAVDLSQTDDKLFNQACAELQIDIISIDVASEKSISGKKVPSLKMALKRGVCLELKYSKAILDQNILRNFLSLLACVNRHKLVEMLIVSSGASTASQLRSPEGVRDLIMASELTNVAAVACVSTNCTKAIQHGVARRSGVMGAIFSWITHAADTDICAKTDATNVSKRKDTNEEVENEPAKKLIKIKS